MPDYIAYYRISPGGRRKGQDELQADVDASEDAILGLDAQRASVARFLAGNTPLAEYTEIESGKKHTNRPRLLAAIDHCKRSKATLVIAKLDRLARNVHFVSGLMESAVDFIAADMPTANRLTLHIMAAFAEHERQMISDRVKAALAAIKTDLAANGSRVSQAKRVFTKLGNPDMPRITELARLAGTRNGRVYAPETRALIRTWRQAGWSMRKIADELNRLGIGTPKGRKWYASSVRLRLNDREDAA